MKRRELPSGLTPRISLGQNFILNEEVLRGLVQDAGVTKQSNVLEIGAGTGTLTGILAERALHVLALEIDKNLWDWLYLVQRHHRNLWVLFRDAMQEDLSALCHEYCMEPVQVVANLPYYITTPLLLKLLAMRPRPTSISVMVQLEVGEKLLAAPGSKQYGPLTIFARYEADVQLMRIVPPETFTPPPKVSSAFMRLDLYPERPLQSTDDELFFRVVRAAFAMRRKTLLNNLQSGLGMSRETAAAAIAAAGLPEAVRGEAMDIADFVRLTDALGAEGLSGKGKPAGT